MTNETLFPIAIERPNLKPPFEIEILCASCITYFPTKNSACPSCGENNKGVATLEEFISKFTKLRKEQILNFEDDKINLRGSSATKESLVEKFENYLKVFVPWMEDAKLIASISPQDHWFENFSIEVIRGYPTNYQIMKGVVDYALPRTDDLNKRLENFCLAAWVPAQMEDLRWLAKINMLRLHIESDNTFFINTLNRYDIFQLRYSASKSSWDFNDNLILEFLLALFEWSFLIDHHYRHLLNFLDMKAFKKRLATWSPVTQKLKAYKAIMLMYSGELLDAELASCLENESEKSLDLSLSMQFVQQKIFEISSDQILNDSKYYLALNFADESVVQETYSAIPILKIQTLIESQYFDRFPKAISQFIARLRELSAKERLTSIKKIGSILASSWQVNPLNKSVDEIDRLKKEIVVQQKNHINEILLSLKSDDISDFTKTLIGLSVFSPSKSAWDIILPAACLNPSLFKVVIENLNRYELKPFLEEVIFSEGVQADTIIEFSKTMTAKTINFTKNYIRWLISNHSEEALNFFYTAPSIKGHEDNVLIEEVIDLMFIDIFSKSRPYHSWLQQIRHEISYYYTHHKSDASLRDELFDKHMKAIKPDNILNLIHLNLMSDLKPSEEKLRSSENILRKIRSDYSSDGNIVNAVLKLIENLEILSPVPKQSGVEVFPEKDPQVDMNRIKIQNDGLLLQAKIIQKTLTQQSTVNEIQTWFQEEMSRIQSSPMDVAQKASEIGALAEEFQSKMQEAIKES